MDLRIKERVAVVTAGGGAICGAAASALASEGARIAVWDINESAATDTVARIAARGGHAVAVRCDATDAGSVKQARSQTVEQLGPPSILVNGTGGSRPGSTTSQERGFADLDPEEMRTTWELNYMSAIAVSQALLSDLVASKEAAIVNVSSVGGLSPLSRSISYSDAKAAVASFTRWLAVEAAREYGNRIRVNAVAPGFVLTEQNRFLLQDEAGDLTERGQTVLDSVPASRFGTPEEIAAVICFLASPQSSFVTGAVYTVDGGYLATNGV